MQEYVDLGATTPFMEECAQVESREYDYYRRARKEARAFIGQLRRMFGQEPNGGWLAAKSHPHDFGTYLTVVCFFDSTNRAAVQFANKCESDGPAAWDHVARSELQLTERS